MNSFHLGMIIMVVFVLLFEFMVFKLFIRDQLKSDRTDWVTISFGSVIMVTALIMGYIFEMNLIAMNDLLG